MLFLLTTLALAQDPLQEVDDPTLGTPVITCEAVIDAGDALAGPALQGPIGTLPTTARPHGRISFLLAACPGTVAGSEEICITLEGPEDDQCLGYLDEDGGWRCEDGALDATEDQVICGDTAHFMTTGVTLDDPTAAIEVTVTEELVQAAPVGNGNGQPRRMLRYTGVNLKLAL